MNIYRTDGIVENDRLFYKYNSIFISEDTFTCKHVDRGVPAACGGGD
jgi:hypothetical protein